MCDGSLILITWFLRDLTRKALYHSERLSYFIQIKLFVILETPSLSLARLMFNSDVRFTMSRKIGKYDNKYPAFRMSKEQERKIKYPYSFSLVIDPNPRENVSVKCFR